MTKKFSEIDRMRFICDMAEKYPDSYPYFSASHDELFLPIGEVTDKKDLEKLEEYGIMYDEDTGDWYIFT